MKLICDIYKSPRQDEMYLYVQKTDALSKVPEVLLEKFGKPVHVMTMLLRAEKKLARVDVEKVLQHLIGTGYYLQMPPPKDKEMQELHAKNSKLF